MDLEGHLLSSRYEVKRKLQSGFFGTTWKAQDRKMKRTVCVKTFLSDSDSQHKELAILKELCDGHFEHENLCRVLDVCVHRAPVTNPTGDLVTHLRYVVFEYCSGSDLFNFLVTGPFEKINRVSNFSEALSRHYFTQILLAVMYLHERGVFHRDIKPENCVLDEHFNLKLTDFGTNKILPISEDPGQVLRTTTKGIGTDSYRAPEVNSYRGYDPSAADIWSLGITLFFMVGIEEMVKRVSMLDPYSRPLLAPLGIVFPFPMFCSKLDSYMKMETELSAYFTSNKGAVLPNQQFWAEWPSIHSNISSNLKNLFNQIFVLLPSYRCTLRDIARHPWLVSKSHLTPDEVMRHMRARCPSGIQTSKEASPRVVTSKLLGGVDQASLRLSLTSQAKMKETDYLTDTELWVMSEQTRQLESIQLDIVCCDDIQELMMDISYCRQLLQDILSSPHDESRRLTPARDVRSPWVRRLLLIVGFLPDDRRALVLTNDAVDLHLLQNALSVVAGVELAVSRSAIPIHTPIEEDEGMEIDFDAGSNSQNSQSVRESVTLRRRTSSDSDGLTLQVTTPDETGLTSFTGTGSPWPSLSTSVPTPTSPARMLIHQTDSQESYWSHYTAGSLSVPRALKRSVLTWLEWGRGQWTTAPITECWS
jgi:serine/threonine protein kinase